ncbi:DUF5677 domain-containing protein [Glycomyces terrestris]|uniref:Uncharacterized protein n=1 Tax=Glycomyces terrestris TaxID=2493553 RepID=A0A426UV47_9ACTN|nr:DUF5677 domain-containing protein [Glycomyces terrestris]RRR98207.1 hypothetical protein EIW28_14915 [Glycomyces terrestris]
MSFPQPNQRSGPLEGHVRRGRVYRPQLAATGVLKIADWFREDLPDLLWPVLVLSELGNAGALRFVRWQKAVQEDLLGRVKPQNLADGLDGRLTGLDRLAAQDPEAKAVVKDRAEEHGLLSGTIARALASYPLRPAKWLVDIEMRPPGQEELDLLARAVLEVLKDGHRESLIKCLYIWSAVQAGTFSTSSETIELLHPYPNDPRTRSKADSVVRSIWGAHKMLLTVENEDYFEPAIKWARVFWGANSMTSGCLRRRNCNAEGEVEEDSMEVPTEIDPGGGDAATTEVPDEGAHLRQRAMDLLASYVEALELSPAQLFDRERQEVHSGLVSRTGRDVIATLSAPDLWCMEHGAHIIRVLVETRIYIQWMAQQDPSIYRAFQEYGAGKAKLYARIVDEVPQEARNADFEEAIKDLEKLSHNDEVLDHRVVDTRDSFAEGKSIRAMAEECGLLDLYRQAYSMASGVAHSEWWSIETHAMERCLNVLHAGHLIPSLSLNSGRNVGLAKSWVEQLYALIRISLDILNTDENAVKNAFAWLVAEEDEGST